MTVSNCSNEPYCLASRLISIEKFEQSAEERRTVVLDEFKAANEQLLRLAELKADAVELQEWLECKDFILCMKGFHLGHLPVNTASLRYCKVEFNGSGGTANGLNAKLRLLLDEFNEALLEGTDYSRVMPYSVSDGMWTDMHLLKTVELGLKREILRHMPIISTPIAAAYLGITADALNDLKMRKPGLFGCTYAGGHSYSMEELNMIARNPLWTYGWLQSWGADKLTEVDVSALDHVVMVDEEVACAYTDMSCDELFNLVPRTALVKRGLRLAGLKKIRVQKLSQQLA